MKTLFAAPTCRPLNTFLALSTPTTLLTACQIASGHPRRPHVACVPNQWPPPVQDQFAAGCCHSATHGQSCVLFAYNFPQHLTRKEA
jgi:hypothetical protein